MEQESAAADLDELRDDDRGEDPVGWALLYDSRWDASLEDEEAPPELIAGGWPVFADGGVGPFHVNDLHRGPGGASSDPAGDPDPVGSALQLVLEDRAQVELVQLLLQDVPVLVALNADGRPVVVRSDDGRLCVMVATCEERRRESIPPDWGQVLAEQLVELLDDGVDVIFNADGPAPVRLDGDLVRESLDLSPDRSAAVLQRLLDERGDRRFGAEDVESSS